jgi:DNA modification methylase
MKKPWIWVMHGDCLEKMHKIEDGSVDLILCDLPYGTTSCKWDSIISFEPLWEHYNRIAKPEAAIVLTSAQPFTSKLVFSNIDDYKYCWYWNKNLASGFQLAKIQPRRAVEEIVIFYRKQPVYNPQPAKSIVSDRTVKVGASNGGKGSANKHGLGTKTRPHTYKIPEFISPTNILNIECVPRATGTIHPTQKPVALMEYLIRTYTYEGQTVLDNCMGSGTTGVACVNTGRNFIGIEKDDKYYPLAVQRIKQAKNKA